MTTAQTAVLSQVIASAQQGAQETAQAQAKKAPRANARKAGDKTAPATKQATAVASKGKETAQTKNEQPATVFYVPEVIPAAGKNLRGFFLALMACQMGGALKANATFKAWKGANLSHHIRQGRVTRLAGDTYRLETAGKNYFSDPSQQVDDEVSKQWHEAVTKGITPKLYNGKMVKAA